MGYAKVFVGVLFLFIAVATTSAEFKCTPTNSTCRSLIDHVPVNDTTLSAVKSLYQIKRFRDLLGANVLPTSTSPNQTLPAKQRIRIPFSCRCKNGTGVSDKPPVYTVKEGDAGLYNISTFTFSNVVTYQKIAEFNKLPNPDKITVGQKLSIPLPCSCDDVDGAKVVHYGLVVESGSSVDQIATVYGTTPAILLNLNGMANASQLLAGQVLDVPLKVTYQEIAKVNGILDPNKIDVGQRLWIPLPCSCNDVEGVKVVHYGHVVEVGSSVDKIAMEYGTTPTILLKLNGMTNASELQANQVLDVPLKACNSSVNSSSLDYPLLVANGTYVYTANDCVNCKCSSGNNYILQCEASGLKPSPNTWSTCPAVQCNNGTSSLYLGNVTALTTCNQTTCAYSGFTKESILTTLATESTCPAGGPTGSPTGSPGSDASRTGMQGFRWNFLFISIQLIFLCFTLF